MGILADTFRAQLDEMQRRDAKLQADIRRLIDETNTLIAELEALDCSLQADEREQ
jgi:hypothetical protein